MSNKHNDPEVYKLAAIFEYSKMGNIEAARLYFSEGLKYHKHCKILHIEEFDLEVQYIELTEGKSLPIALRKYKNLVKCFKGDLEFHITLIDKALQFNTVRELQYHVVRYKINFRVFNRLGSRIIVSIFLLHRDMFEEYKHDERMWQKLAKINFEGFIFEYDKEKLMFDMHGRRKLK